jgi:hypothetical protein
MRRTWTYPLLLVPLTLSVTGAGASARPAPTRGSYELCIVQTNDNDRHLYTYNVYDAGNKDKVVIGLAHSGYDKAVQCYEDEPLPAAGYVLDLDALPGHNGARNSWVLKFVVEGPGAKPVTTTLDKKKQPLTVQQPFTVAAGKLTKITATTEIVAPLP